MASPRLHAAAALFASSLVVLAAARSAEGACNATCHRDIDRCMATQCQGVPHAACRRRCKPAAIRTLAYALSECRVDAAGRFSGREVLRALRGNQEPITLVDFGSSGARSGPGGAHFLYATMAFIGPRRWVFHNFLRPVGGDPGDEDDGEE